MPAQIQYLCYLEPHRLTLVGNNGVNLQTVLSGDTSSDLEVVDGEKLTNLIIQLLQANSVLPGISTILLAPSLLFEQDMTTIPPSQKEEIAQRFLDSVPFESVGSKKYVVVGKERLIAANKEFFDAVRRGFMKKEIHVSSIVPYSILQTVFPELAQSIDPAFIFNRMDSFRQYSITEPDIIRPSGIDTKSGLKGRRDMALLGVFVFLLLILGYLVAVNFIFVAPSQQQPAKVIPTVAPTRALVFPTVTGTVPRSTTPSTP